MVHLPMLLPLQSRIKFLLQKDVILGLELKRSFCDLQVENYIKMFASLELTLALRWTGILLLPDLEETDTELTLRPHS